MIFIRYRLAGSSRDKDTNKLLVQCVSVNIFSPGSIMYLLYRDCLSRIVSTIIWQSVGTIIFIWVAVVTETFSSKRN